MKNKIVAYAKSGLFAVALVVGLSTLQAAWLAPTGGTIPPADNPSAPINVGTATQIKDGNLGANGTISSAYADFVTQIKSPKYCIGTSCITAWSQAGGGAETDPTVQPFAKAAPTACPSGQVTKYDGISLKCVTDAGITSETDPTVKSFAKATLPTCGTGTVLSGNGTSLSCIPISSVASVADVPDASWGTTAACGPTTDYSTSDTLTYSAVVPVTVPAGKTGLLTSNVSSRYLGTSLPQAFSAIIKVSGDSSACSISREVNPGPTMFRMYTSTSCSKALASGTYNVNLCVYRTPTGGSASEFSKFGNVALTIF